MSLWDDLHKFGTGMLDSVGEGFDNLVEAYTTPTETVNPKTQSQNTQLADNHGNKVTPQSDTQQDNTLLYIGGGVAAVAVLGLILVVAKK